MILVFVQLARSLKLPASKLLNPLSYVAGLGGMLPLIGTSKNLLVSGVARAHGVAAFSNFEVTPLEIVLVGWGMLYWRFVAPRLLPDQASMADLLVDKNQLKFLSESVVLVGSDRIGRPVTGVQLFKREGVRFMDVLRGDLFLRRDLRSVTLVAGDRVVLRSQVSELLSLQLDKTVRRVDQLSAVETKTAEVLIAPGFKKVGCNLRGLRLRRRFSVYQLAVYRRNQNIGQNLDAVIFRIRNTLLLEGSRADIHRLSVEMDLVDVSRPSSRAFRRSHRPIAIVAFAVLGVAPLLLLSLCAVALVLITRCIDVAEAFSFIEDWLLALLLAMLTIGAALEHSGALRLSVSLAAPQLKGLPPVVIVWLIYLLTSLLTELVSNNAVAVLVTPIAISLAEALGVNARPLVAAVMVAASASFAIPIGYQTNMMVYGPGEYKFTDFIKVGLPSNLSVGLIASVLIRYIWPL